MTSKNMNVESESHFKDCVIRDLRSVPDTWFYKTQEVGRKGIPDIIACIKGKFVAIELKREGNKPTPLQDLTLTRIRATKGLAFWTSPSQWPEHRKMLDDLYRTL